MKRTEPPRALERFRSYKRTADALKSYKDSQKHDRKKGWLAKAASLNCEDALDDAYAEIALVAGGFSEQAASMLEAHYLLGMQWIDTAGTYNLSLYQTKWRCYKALKWLDGQQDKMEA